MRKTVYIKDYVPHILQKIINCLDVCYRKLVASNDNLVRDDVTPEVREGDSLLHHICVILNSKVWPSDVNDRSLCLQIESITFVYNHFSKVNSLKNVTLEEITHGYMNIVKYVGQYFPYQTIEPIKLWQDIYALRNDIDKQDWIAAFYIVEIGMCAPQSNAALERFFRQLKVIKSDIRSRLNNDHLNALLRVKVTGPSLGEFHDSHVEKCVNLWYNSKSRRLHKKERKAYKPRGSTDRASTSQ